MIYAGLDHVFDQEASPSGTAPKGADDACGQGPVEAEGLPAGPSDRRRGSRSCREAAAEDRALRVEVEDGDVLPLHADDTRVPRHLVGSVMEKARPPRERGSSGRRGRARPRGSRSPRPGAPRSRSSRRSRVAAPCSSRTRPTGRRGGIRPSCCARSRGAQRARSPTPTPTASRAPPRRSGPRPPGRRSPGSARKIRSFRYRRRGGSASEIAAEEDPHARPRARPSWRARPPRRGNRPACGSARCRRRRPSPFK